MANNISALGLPSIYIKFSSKASTLIARSTRGTAALILNEGVEDTVTTYTVLDTTDIPDLSESNVDLVKKALLGTPAKLQVITIPLATHTDTTVTETETIVTDEETGATDTVTITDTSIVTVDATVTQADALRKIADTRINYICHPTGNTQDQQDLATWVKAQRANKHKTVKAVVANCAADDYGVVNFTTGGIKVVNPAYTDALELTGEVPADIPQYNTYTAAQYTARVAGILAGIGLDRSATYYELSEVAAVDEYDDIDTHINNGELCLFDEHDCNGVKIARGCNSLTTFTSETGQDFRYIKNVDSMDMILDDIRDTFRNDYVGKVTNDYNNKQLLVSAINTYFTALGGNVLDISADNANYVEIDYEANRDWAKTRGEDVNEMTESAILRYNTGTNVFLTGRITLVNAMEDMRLNIALD